MKSPKFISWRQNLFFVWLGQILAAAGSSLVIPFIPLYVRENFHLVDEGQRAMVVSLFFSLGLFSFCLSNPIWGAIADRYGRKLMLLRAYLVTGITFPLMYFMPTVSSFIAMRFVAAMFSGTISASQALVAATTPDEHQGFALGVLSSAFWSGNMLGMVLGGITVHYYGYLVSFLVCGGVFLLGGILTLFFVQENFVRPPEPAKTTGSKWHLPAFKSAVWWMMGLFFLIAAARRCNEPFLPMLIEIIGGVDKAAINTGIVSALAAVGGILSGIVFGRLSDRCEAAKLSVPALVMTGIFTIWQAGTQSIIALSAAQFLTYFAVGGLDAILLSQLSKTVDKTRRGAAFGWSSSIRVFGGMAGSLAGGGLIALTNTRGVFYIAGILIIILVPITFRGLKAAARSQQPSVSGNK